MIYRRSAMDRCYYLFWEIAFVPNLFLQASKVNQELADGCINQDRPAYLVPLAIEDLQGQLDHQDQQAAQVQTYKTLLSNTFKLDCILTESTRKLLV